MTAHEIVVLVLQFLSPLIGAVTLYYLAIANKTNVEAKNAADEAREAAVASRNVALAAKQAADAAAQKIEVVRKQTDGLVEKLTQAKVIEAVRQERDNVAQIAENKTNGEKTAMGERP